MSMNPRKTTEKIKNDYLSYIESILEVKDPEITNLAKSILLKSNMVKGPFLETTLPFVMSKSLKELAQEGLISSEFEKIGENIHYEDWKLRIHQEEALRKVVGENKNIILSTGTGSGKTECYLYSIFNELMKQKEKGELNSGVRALLLFPMNALANDQQKKLRKLLENYPDITFGRYTGETLHKLEKETPEEAELRMHEEYNISHQFEKDKHLRKSLKNEYMCREYMAKNPPHILLTNYAMLEYLLLRPDTSPFFDNDSASNWKFIVLDEAHTYKGANGTEIAFLLRRLKERIRKHMKEDFKCIATSATLGNEGSSKELAEFAECLFGEPFSKDDVITTKRIEKVKPINGVKLGYKDYLKIKEESLILDSSEREAFLYRKLKDDLRIFELYELLKNKPKRIEDVSSNLFEELSSEQEKEDALITLIELAAAAKENSESTALLPGRYHLFIKSLEGMFIQYFPKKIISLDRKEKVKGISNEYSVFELANCEKCKQEYLVGKTVKKHGDDYFEQTSSAEKPEYYLITDDTDKENWNYYDEDDVVEEKTRISNLNKFRLCLSCGKITDFNSEHGTDCCDEKRKKIVTVLNLSYLGYDKESNSCPCCGATKKGLIKRFLTANQPATFVVGKSLYDAIPPKNKDKEEKNTQKTQEEIDIFEDLFGAVNEENNKEEQEIVDESGRKLLVFSDNRQEAAFFAGSFEKRYLQIVWDKIILKCLIESKEKDGVYISDLITLSKSMADKYGIYALDIERGNNLTDLQKKDIASKYVMREFGLVNHNMSPQGKGYIEVFPEPIKMSEKELFTVRGNELWNLIRYNLDTLRQKRVFTYPEGINPKDEFFMPVNYNGYFRSSGSEKNHKGTVFGFIPEENYTNKRLALMEKLYKNTKDYEPRKELGTLYNIICGLQKLNFLSMEKVSTAGNVYQLNHSKWKFKYVNDEQKLFKCNKCGKIFNYSVKNLCPELKCDGTLVEISANKLRESGYYNQIYKDDKIIPMVCKEHTAQLTSETAGKYQIDFEEGKINVLSCSTTFEMGVDVGELEATFLRNVPPETSNYIQRAGRAGRRSSSAAFSVTFARRNSHDMTFYLNPPSIISGKINAPILEIENSKIATRHLNSIVIAWFLRKRPEFFEGNTKKIISKFGEGDMVCELKKELASKPKDLLKSIHDVIPQKICDELNVDNWGFIEELTSNDSKFSKAVAERVNSIDNLNSVINIQGKTTNKQINTAKYANKLIETLEAEKTINFLSSKGIIPKYGFPIESVSLDVISGNEREASQIELTRDLKLAISEFAPPSQIVANGKIWESYSLNTVPDKSWPAYYYYVCNECKRIYPPEGDVVTIHHDENDIDEKICDKCGRVTSKKMFITPIFGFSTYLYDKPKQVGESRPDVYYITQTQFWGIDNLTEKEKAESKAKELDYFGKNVEMVYSPGGKLFVLNQGKTGHGLYVCEECGYTIDNNNKKNELKAHKDKYGRSCHGITKKVSLGHTFSTDILKIKFPVIKSMENNSSKDLYLSLMYSLLEGASVSLGINRSDINGCVTMGNEIILFDDTPGGSGFVKNIFNNFTKVIESALKKVNGACGCTEETSCYGCLRNYGNQYFHDYLSRGQSYNYLKWLINEINISEDGIISVKKTTKKNELTSKKNLDYSYESEMLIESVEQLKEIKEDINDEESIDALNELINEFSKYNNLERPYKDEKIEIGNKNIWPEIFWPKSKVALFLPENISNYKNLSEYDWHCYLLDRNLNVKDLVKHIEVS